MLDLHAAQLDLCRRYDAAFTPTEPGTSLAVAVATLLPGLPLHGVRHVPHAGASGWLVWAGDLSRDPDFFQTQPIEALGALAPGALPYLGLPPGWRFLLAPGYEDAWFDHSLLGA